MILTFNSSRTTHIPENLDNYIFHMRSWPRRLDLNRKRTNPNESRRKTQSKFHTRKYPTATRSRSLINDHSRDIDLSYILYQDAVKVDHGGALPALSSCTYFYTFNIQDAEASTRDSSVRDLTGKHARTEPVGCIGFL
jgi:hypothetical protein